MKFIYIFFFCAIAIMITACSGEKKAAPTQAISNPAPTATIMLVTAEPATPKPTAGSMPTAFPLPDTAAQATPPSTTTPLSSPTPTALPPTEVTAVSPAADTPGTLASDGSTGCTNIATFNADVTVPDGTSFRQGDVFVKTWRITNVGTCNWDSGYTLVFAGGELMNAPLSNPLPEIPHDTAADISLNMAVPSRGGVYQSNWQFQSPDGERFGIGVPPSGLLWAQIAVSFVEPTQSSSSDSALGLASQPVAQGTCSAQHDPSIEAQVLALINAARANQGLDPLDSQGQLAAAAQAHSMDMACNDIVSHVGSDGSLWYNRVAAQGYANYNSSRENIYVGNPAFGGTADGAFNWWWNSQIHHDNMLNPDISQIGVAYVYNPNSEYGGYYTTVFARP